MSGGRDALCRSSSVRSRVLELVELLPRGWQARQTSEV